MTERNLKAKRVVDFAFLLVLACGSCVLLSLVFPTDSEAHDILSVVGYFGFLVHCASGLALLVMFNIRRWIPLIIAVPSVCMAAVWLTLKSSPEPAQFEFVLEVASTVINGCLAMLVLAASIGWARWCSSRLDYLESNTKGPNFSRDFSQVFSTAEGILWSISATTTATFLCFGLCKDNDIHFAYTKAVNNGHQLHICIFAATVATAISAALLRKRRTRGDISQ